MTLKKKEQSENGGVPVRTCMMPMKLAGPMQNQPPRTIAGNTGQDAAIRQRGAGRMPMAISIPTPDGPAQCIRCRFFADMVRHGVGRIMKGVMP
jgi:hypothetical protein